MRLRSAPAKRSRVTGSRSRRAWTDDVDGNQDWGSTMRCRAVARVIDAKRTWSPFGGPTSRSSSKMADRSSSVMEPQMS